MKIQHDAATHTTRLTTTNYAKVVMRQKDGAVSLNIQGYWFTAKDLRALAGVLQGRADLLAPKPLPALTPQDVKVMRHLRTRGSISALEAMDGYRIRRLAASIYRLKQHGWGFRPITKYDAANQRYTRYYLETDGQQRAPAA